MMGGWLAGALLWHFAVMRLLVVNGLFYVTRGLVTGRFRAQLLPMRRRNDSASSRRCAAGWPHDDLTHARRDARHDLQARAIR